MIEQRKPIEMFFMKLAIIITIAGSFLLCSSNLYAQSKLSNTLFSLGMNSYQNKEYLAAIEYFLRCDSIDISDANLNENRKVYSKMWIASSYFRMGQDDIAYEISPKFYKYPPIDRNKTIVSDSLGTIADLLFEDERYEEALEVLMSCAIIEKDSLGYNSLWYTNTITECGYLCYNMGDYEKAIEYGELANKIVLEICGLNSEEHIETLYNLIDYYGEYGDVANTRHYLKEIELINNDFVFNDKEECANALFKLAGYYEALEDYNESVRLIIQANKVADKGTEARDVRNVYLLKDLIHLKKYNEAIIVGEEIIKREITRIPADTLLLGITLSNLADCYYHIGNYIEAVNTSNHSINFYEVLNDENKEELKSEALDILSNSYDALGLYEDAIKYGKEALGIGERNVDYDKRKYAIRLSNLAYYNSQIGNNVEAYILCEEAYNIINNLGVPDDDPDLILILSNLATYYGYLGNYSKAVDLCKRVLSIRQNTVGKNTLDYAISLNNLASFLDNLDGFDTEDVISIYKESIGIIESISGKNNQLYISSLTNLASLYEDKNPQMALNLYDEALLLSDSLYQKKDYPSKIHILYNIANTYNGQKQYENAIQNLKKAYSIMCLFGLEDNSEYINVKQGLYSLFLKSNRIAEAKEWMRGTFNSVYRQVVENFPRITSREREMFWSLYSEWFYEDLSQIIPFDSSGEVAETLYDSSLLSKSILLNTNLLIEKLLEEENPSLLIELQRLRQSQKVSEILNNDELSVNTDSILFIKEIAERNLLNGSKVYNGLHNYYRINCQDIKKVLNERDIAIEFIVLPTDSMKVYYALCLRKEYDTPHIVRLFDSSQIILTTNIEKSNLDSISTLIWKPLQEELLNVEDIFFSPIGELHEIGFEYASGLEQYKLFRLSSTKEIIEIKEYEEYDEIKDKNTILYGGISYAEQDNPTVNSISQKQLLDDFSKQVSVDQHRSFVDSLDLRGLSITYLPGTLQEVLNIKKTFEENNYHARVYTGSNATETSVKALSGQVPNVLHIATHGFFFSENRAKNESDFRFLLSLNPNNTTIEDKSLIRSGLLFAGASQALNGQDMTMDSDDGILTAQEISQLDLRGINLVVLSACDTGKGDIVKSEGVFGLQRGFKKAGVKSILMSLWKVSDITTEMLMTEFYKNICEGKSKHESLYMAQKKVREFKDSEGNNLFEDPYYWAGFILLD